MNILFEKINTGKKYNIDSVLVPLLILFLIVVLSFSLKDISTLITGEKAIGTVTSVEVGVNSRSFGGVNRLVNVSFANKDGEQYQIVSGANSRIFAANDKVTLFYNKDNPAKSAVLLLPGTFLLPIVSLLALLVLILVVKVYKKKA